jgi:predicted nucleic acid-binding protein
MNVFVDTSAILALLDQDDISHARAVQIWQRLVNEEHALVTTNYVILETAALLQTRIGLEAVRGFQNDIVPLLKPIWIDKDVHELSVQALLLANRRWLSLVDCSSMTIARQSGIDHFFAFDRHFSERGFTCLLA